MGSEVTNDQAIELDEQNKVDQMFEWTIQRKRDSLIGNCNYQIVALFLMLDEPGIIVCLIDGI